MSRTKRTKGAWRRQRREGAALIELVLVLPLLSFILVASTDFARIFHDYIVITDGARNGALYASQNSTQAASAYQAGITAAALADSAGFSPAPSVVITSGSLGPDNNYVDVTLSFTFKTISAFPGVPSSMVLSRKVRMRIPPATYRLS